MKDEKSSKTASNLWKARRQRRTTAKARRKHKLQEEKETELQNKTGISEAESVFTEKVFEPLQAILDAYEARLRPNQTNEERLREYPDPEIEKQRLDISKK